MASSIYHFGTLIWVVYKNYPSTITIWILFHWIFLKTICKRAKPFFWRNGTVIFFRESHWEFWVSLSRLRDHNCLSLYLKPVWACALLPMESLCSFRGANISNPAFFWDVLSIHVEFFVIGRQQEVSIAFPSVQDLDGHPVRNNMLFSTGL